MNSGIHSAKESTYCIMENILMDPNHLSGGLKRGLTMSLVLQMENVTLPFLHYTGLLHFCC